MKLIARAKRALNRWKLSQVERKVHNVYDYIDKELRQHEQQMVFLRDELAKARDAQRLARVKAWGACNG